MTGFSESVVEDAALVWQGALGYAVLHGRDISPVGDTLTPTPPLGTSVGRLPAGEGLSGRTSTRIRSAEAQPSDKPRCVADIASKNTQHIE